MITVENYNVYKIHDMLYPKEIEILKNGIGSITRFRDNKENYHYDYRDKPGNLFRILDEGRYKRGAYYIMTTKDDEYVLSTGWNEYDRDTALSATRSIIHPKYRHLQLITHHFIYQLAQEAKNAGYKDVWMVYNEKNKTLMDYALNGREEIYKKVFKHFKPKGMGNIYNTPQYILEFLPLSE